MPFRDFEEFIAALRAHGVRFLVVGAHAVAFHGRPRATKDLDLFLDRSVENARRTLAAIREFFGGVDLGYEPDDLTAPDWIVQLGVAPVRIDLLNTIQGVPDFEDAWLHRAEGQFGDQDVAYLSLEDLLRAKEAAGRPQDKADVRVLRGIRARRAVQPD